MMHYIRKRWNIHTRAPIKCQHLHIKTANTWWRRMKA